MRTLVVYEYDTNLRSVILDDLVECISIGGSVHVPNQFGAE